MSFGLMLKNCKEIELQKISASENKEVEKIMSPGSEDEVLDMANCLMILSRQYANEDSAACRVFACKTCNRQFPTFQALGGHRASHKKPRLMAGTRDFHHFQTPGSGISLCPHCDSASRKSVFNSSSSRYLCESCHHCWTRRKSTGAISRTRSDLGSQNNSCSEFRKMIQGNYGDQAHNSSQAYFQTVAWSSSPPDVVVDLRGFTDTGNQNYNSSEAYSQTAGGSSSPPDVVAHLRGFTDTGNQNPIVQTHLLNQDQLVKLAEIVFGVSAAAAYTSSSTFPMAANAVGSIASLTAISLRHRGRTATRILAKLGAIACAVGILAAAGQYLPEEYRWVAGVAFLMPATAVAFA